MIDETKSGAGVNKFNDMVIILREHIHLIHEDFKYHAVWEYYRRKYSKHGMQDRVMPFEVFIAYPIEGPLREWRDARKYLAAEIPHREIAEAVMRERGLL